MQGFAPYLNVAINASTNQITGAAYDLNGNMTNVAGNRSVAATVISRGLLLACPLGIVFAQQVFFDRSCPSVRDRAVVLPSARFTRSAVEKLAGAFLDDLGPRTRIARLTIGASQDGLARALFRYDRHATYESTIAEIRRLKLPDMPVARVLRINGSALLSYLDASGYSESLLQGSSNPTKFTERNATLELVHFTLTEPGPALRASAYSVTLYFKVTPFVSISGLSAVTRRIVDLTALPMVAVEARPDVYFLTTLDFPVVFPFQAKAPLPNRAEFESAPTAGCVYTETEGLRCSSSGPILLP